MRLVVGAVLPVLVLGGCIGSLALLPTNGPALASVCGSGGPAVGVDAAAVPVEPVAGYQGQQLVNAALVMNAARTLGLDVRAQTIGVMTAMGESSLVVLDYGDTAGPDSRGLFQQRANGAWGSYADRMDPSVSAASFFRALTAVPGWDTLPPTIAAHRTQRNADPFHYERYWDPAVAVVQALAGVEATTAGVAVGTGGLSCTGATPDAVGAQGWTKPAVGPVTSGFGLRRNPVTREYRLHAGTDIGAPCEGPIYAAAAGTVVTAGPAAGYGNLVTVDHGGGLTTRYAHMYGNGLTTGVGAVVSAGQQIGRVGSAGDSTGCHLHLEIRLRDDPVDPVPYLGERGVVLG